MAERGSPSKKPTSAYPEPPPSPGNQVQPSPPSSSASSIASSSSSESEQRPSSARHSRLSRPRMPNRPKSSIIIPKDKDVFQRNRPEYPPNDARAMSPRRNSQDLERIGATARESLKDQARTLQSSLQALAERIDEVKSDHDKLESENRFLQDYIGGLTRTMSQRDIGSSSSTTSKNKIKR